LVALLDEIDGEAELEPIEEQHDREYDFAEFESCDWSNDPNVPQEGERWHGHVTLDHPANLLLGARQLFGRALHSRRR
jgi:hypothetical protein